MEAEPTLKNMQCFFCKREIGSGETYALRADGEAAHGLCYQIHVSKRGKDEKEKTDSTE